MINKDEWMERDPDYIRSQQEFDNNSPLKPIINGLDNIAWDFLHAIRVRIAFFGTIQSILLAIILWRVW